MQDYMKFTNDKYNKDVVFINSTTDVYFMYDDIYDDLSQKNGESFSVLVDLFLRNGFSYNRFVNIIFNGKGKYKISLVNQRDVPEDLKKDIRCYLKNNQEVLNNSVLSQETKDFIIKY